MKVEKLTRKSFPVDAVRVTKENFNDVAKWCQGEIHEDDSKENPSNYPYFIKVRVLNPLTERQTKAYVGDWVLYAGKGYKVYTDKALKKSFDTKVESRHQPEPAVVQNVFVQGEPGPDTGIQHDSGFPHIGDTPSNPGGTHSV